MAGTDREIELRERFAAEPFAVLATHGPDGRLDLVPCCFAVATSEEAVAVVTAVDHKPKRHDRLARLANVGRDPNVTFLVDHRDPEDWSRLWWVRVNGQARVVDDGPDHESAIDALVEKYAQYQERPPLGPVIRVDELRWTGWQP